MAIDIIARGMAASLTDASGRIAAEKMPVMDGVPEDTQFYPVGALADGALLEGKTDREILMMMLYGIINPKLLDPSLTINITSPMPMIIGEEGEVTGEILFDRGSISPAYGTSGMRAGEISRILINNNETEAHFSFKFIPQQENTSFNCNVFYNEGEQPLNSIGQKYDAPYPAGQLSTIFNIESTYGLYHPEDGAINFTSFEDEVGSGYEAVISAETENSKQSFAVASTKRVIGVKQYEPYSQTWMWIGGSPEASLTYFDTNTIDINNVNYTVYIHNGSLTGERELRIYVE